MSKNTNGKAEVLRRTIMCVDRATDPNVARELRHLRRSIEEKDRLDKRCAQEMNALLTELQSILAQNKPQMATVYLTRLRELADGNAEIRKRGGIMGLFDKLKSKLSGNEKKAEDDLLRNKAREAEEQIFELEKRIAEESDKRSKLLGQLKDKVKACAGLDPESYEYKLAREEAKALKPSIDGIEKTINMYVRQLQSSAKYQAMVASGRATLDLQEMTPDPNEAVALLDMITERMQMVSEGMQDFEAAIAKSQAAFDKAVGVNALKEDDEFDRMVATERKIIEKQAAEEKAAEEAAKKAAAEAKAAEDREIDRLIAEAKQEETESVTAETAESVEEAEQQAGEEDNGAQEVLV